MAVNTLADTRPKSGTATSNGITFNYIKMYSGLMLYWWKMNITASESSPANFSKRGTATAVFPEPFVGVSPNVYASISESAGWWHAHSVGQGLTECYIGICGDTATTKEVSCFAMGFWK